MGGLRDAFPEFRLDCYLCRNDLRKIRIQLIRTLFERPEGELGELENLLAHEGEHLPDNYNQEYQKELTIGERLSQRATDLVGSWGFILLFAIFVIIWILYNIQTEVKEHFDPFPFILLNLTLSCMAAVQAPIIMMAQKRLAKRERLRADEDYYTTLKAELEIRQLNAKIDAYLKLREEEKRSKKESA